MTQRQIQSAYETAQPGVEAGSVHDRIYRAMFEYLTVDLGRDPERSRERAKAEADRRPAIQICDELERSGVKISGRRILDLGAGLGGLTTELASRGGHVVSIEPGEAWRRIAAARLAEAGDGQVIGAVGEFLPLADCSVDLIVSLQVLEHVQDPLQVIRELYRVLKPGGQLFIAYENYLGFREPHYDVPWLPLLPKHVGAAYLKLLGRDPRFLLESVTYTTFPSVRREMLRLGFVYIIDQLRLKKLQSADSAGVKWRILRMFAGRNGAAVLSLLSALDFSGRLFRTFTEEFMLKPEGVSSAQ